jgi:hypothetical protein
MIDRLGKDVRVMVFVLESLTALGLGDFSRSEQ